MIQIPWQPIAKGAFITLAFLIVGVVGIAAGIYWAMLQLTK